MTTPERVYDSSQIIKKRMLKLRENAQPDRHAIDGPGWFYCKRVAHKIPVCKMTTCKNYPCNKEDGIK